MAVVDPAELASGPGFGARLLALLPALPMEAAARLADPVCPAAAVEPVVMELQRLAGAPSAATAPSRSRAGRAAHLRFRQQAQSTALEHVRCGGRHRDRRHAQNCAAYAALAETARAMRPGRLVVVGGVVAAPGDRRDAVLVFGYGSSITELTAALRPTRPEIVQYIEAEAAWFAPA